MPRDEYVYIECKNKVDAKGETLGTDCTVEFNTYDPNGKKIHVVRKMGHKNHVVMRLKQ